MFLHPTVFIADFFSSSLAEKEPQWETTASKFYKIPHLARTTLGNGLLASVKQL